MEALIAQLKLDIGTTIGLIGAGVAVASWAKQRFHLTGLGIDLIVLLVMGLLSYVSYTDQPAQIITSTLVCYFGATGGWDAAKQLIKKGKA